MDEQFGISRGDVEAAEAETARKLAADRAVELESPALRTYVSENPDADMTLLKFMDEMKTKGDLAAQESRQQVDALINLLYSNSVFSELRGFPHSHVSVRVLPVGISVSH